MSLVESSAPSSKSSKLSAIAEQPNKARLPIDALERLWLRMATRYGHAWVSQYGAEPSGIGGAEWAETLAGLALEQIGAGFAADRARGAEWPPSAPLFRSLCLAIPGFAQIRRSIVAKDRTPFMRLVWQHIDGYRFSRADQTVADRMLRDAYEIARDHVMRGGALPPEPVAEIAPPVAKGMPATEQTARQHLDNLAKLFGSEP